MKTVRVPFVFLLLVFVLTFASCSPAAPTVDANQVRTQAAQTAIVQLTAAATLLPPATATKAPTNTLAPSATAAATDTPAAPATDTPAAAAPTATPTTAAPASADDMAAFVTDVNYPDNTQVSAGATFEKSWQIKNIGKSTWTVAYTLVCIDPGKMQCTDSSAFPKEVKPGDTVDLKAKLTAPSANGTYRAYFRLRNAAGQFFKLDKTGDLWVQIVVGPLTATATATSEASASTATPAPTVAPTATETPKP